MRFLLVSLLLMGCRDPRAWDADGDAFDASEHGGNDCNDQVASIHPGATELCNGVDDDCDGRIDEAEDVDLSSGLLLAVDADGDGHGDPALLVAGCKVAPGLVVEADDCDDSNPDVHPGANDTCSGLDEDCSGKVDDGPDIPRWFVDADGDGFGTPLAEVQACTPPAGHTARQDDCNDADPNVHPDAEERCSGRDDNCDGLIDDEDPGTKPDERPWFVDADGDGFGIREDEVVLCDLPAGHSAAIGDCDDGNADRFPGAIELCDGVDQDCDGAVDEEPADGQTVYADFDQDGYGVREVTLLTCVPVAGFTDVAGDCADALPHVNPEALEGCNGLDDDCDGLIDDDDDSLELNRVIHYRDLDGDGAGRHAETQLRCLPNSDWVLSSTDCNDDNPDVGPHQDEVCNNGIDDNCDALATPCGFRGVIPDSSVVEEALVGGRIGNQTVYWSDPLLHDVDGDGQQQLVLQYNGWVAPTVHPGDVLLAEDLPYAFRESGGFQGIGDFDRDGSTELAFGGQLDGGAYTLRAHSPMLPGPITSLDDATLVVRRDSSCSGSWRWSVARDLPGIPGYILHYHQNELAIIPAASVYTQRDLTSCDVLQMAVGWASDVRRFFTADVTGDGIDSLFIHQASNSSARERFARFDDPRGVLRTEDASAILEFVPGISNVYINSVVDLNGDGRDDIVAAASFGYQSRPFLIDGAVVDAATGPLTREDLTLFPVDGGSVTLGDFDGDAQTDIMRSNWGEAALDFFHGPFHPGEERELESRLMLESIGYVYTGDVNADGRVDLLLDPSGSGTLQVLFGSSP